MDGLTLRLPRLGQPYGFARTLRDSKEPQVT